MALYQGSGGSLHVGTAPNRTSRVSQGNPARFDRAAATILAANQNYNSLPCQPSANYGAWLLEVWAEGSKGDWRFALAAGAGFRAQNAPPPIIKSDPNTGEESSSTGQAAGQVV